MTFIYLVLLLWLFMSWLVISAGNNLLAVPTLTCAAALLCILEILTKTSRHYYILIFHGIMGHIHWMSISLLSLPPPIRNLIFIHPSGYRNYLLTSLNGLYRGRIWHMHVLGRCLFFANSVCTFAALSVRILACYIVLTTFHTYVHTQIILFSLSYLFFHLHIIIRNLFYSWFQYKIAYSIFHLILHDHFLSINITW